MELLSSVDGLGRAEPLCTKTVSMSLSLNHQLPTTTSWKKYCSVEPLEGQIEKTKKRAAVRKDRALNCHRSVYLKTGMVSHSRGSCYLECGNTKIVAAVYGPRENAKSELAVMEGKLSCKFIIGAFSLQNEHIDDRLSAKICSDFELFVEDAFSSVVNLQKFPKSTLELSVLVLENDGGVLGCALTALSCALTNAGIEMYDLLIGTCCAIVASEAVEDSSQILVDPCFEEEVDFTGVETAFSKCKKNSSVVTVGFLPNIQQISTLNQRGQSVNSAALSEAVKACVESCHNVHSVVKTFLKKEIEQSGE